MAFTNSSLVDFRRISPNCSKPRNHIIDTITIHHMAGNLTVEQCGGIFAETERQASSNYAVDSSGRVGLYVEEKNRSWCTSNADNDNRAVTIEVANDVVGGNWHVSDTALAKLIELCTDICKRNGIERINYTGDKNGNLTMHKWFAATGCPGEYLGSKFPYIAAEVNKRLCDADDSERTKDEIINDNIWELGVRGIISNKALWLKKAADDINCYWLIKKVVDYLKVKGV